MAERLILLGGGGHAKVVADIALKCGYRELAFLDDAPNAAVMGLPMAGKISDVPKFVDDCTAFVIAIGNNAFRQKIAAQYDLPWATLIHPSAQIGYGAEIGAGTVVMAGAVINPFAVVGRHCIINSSAVVEHDNHLLDFVHISPHAALGGTVIVGEGTHIGIGASVRNNLSICGGCTIGAGAAVVKNIEECGVYVGVPAKRIR